MRLPRFGVVAVAAAAATALVLTGCSSTGGKQTESTTSTAGGGAAASDSNGAGGGGQVATTKRYTIAMVTHEQPGDTFWDKIRAGAQAAAAKDNIDLKYSNDPDATKQATLIQNAVQSKVDGIATTLVTPDALKGAVQQAIAAKIPVVGFNSGIDAYKSLGALMYFGSDETLAGQTVGDKINAAGGKHPLCVIQAQGSVALEARCAGVKSKVAATENLDVNGADQNATQSTIQAKLQQDPSIDYVVTPGVLRSPCWPSSRSPVPAARPSSSPST